MFIIEIKYLNCFVATRSEFNHSLTKLKWNYFNVHSKDYTHTECSIHEINFWKIRLPLTILNNPFTWPFGISMHHHVLPIAKYISVRNFIFYFNIVIRRAFKIYWFNFSVRIIKINKPKMLHKFTWTYVSVIIFRFTLYSFDFMWIGFHFI